MVFPSLKRELVELSSSRERGSALPEAGNVANILTTVQLQEKVAGKSFRN